MLAVRRSRMKTVTYDETLWKLVPVVPTEVIIDAMEEAYDQNCDSSLDLCHWECLVPAYHAALKAAPEFTGGDYDLD
jgi:hypothetical protein